VTEPAFFLTTFAQALAASTLYTEGHPARERAIDAAYEALLDLLAKIPRPVFTFLGDELLCGSQPIRELRAWDWATRLSNAGVQRLEFDADVSREEFEGFLDEVLARLTLHAIGTAESRQMSSSRIRFGTVGVKGEVKTDETPTAVSNYSLGAEAEAIRWLHGQVQNQRALHLAEAEAVVTSLSVAMHGDKQIMIPLLRLRSFDEYTTTHSMNVSVLAMAFAEFLGLGPRDVRGFGIAGLLHDIGKVSIPIEVLTKPGKLTDHERHLMNQHPTDGARTILRTAEAPDLAAVVAYEHHIMIDGGGYPPLRFSRDCHYASRLVHVCDVYDALRTRRPYRDAWPAQKVLDYIAERAGTEFDGELARAYNEMMQQWDQSVAVVEDESASVHPPAQPPAESHHVQAGEAAASESKS
jgi:putative nucleotidyltransferase with HDIG domain